MRIKALDIKDFGKFNQSSQLKGLNEQLVIFFGKNEAGKTTLFHLIKTLLYGFTPANLEQHPYTSWQNERIEFSALIQTEAKQEATIYRRLLSSPKGEFTLENRVLELRNQPIPLVNHISSEIYDRIYALQVEDLMAIQGKAWDQVQDKLLANFGNQLIKNTKVVLKELQEEMNGIYRSSGKGKALTKELELQIRALKKEAKEAQQRQELLWEYERQLQTLGQEIQMNIEKKSKIKGLIRSGNRLIPFQRLLHEKQHLLAQIKNPEKFHLLPENAVEQLQYLQEKLIVLDQELNQQKQIKLKLVNKQTLLTEPEKKILANRDNIEVYYQEALAMQGLAHEIRQLEVERVRLEERQNHEARNLLTGLLTADQQQAILKLNIPALRIHMAHYQKIRGQLQEIQKFTRHQKQVQPSRPALKGSAGGLVLGGCFLALAGFYKSIPLLLGGALALIYALVDVIFERRQRQKEKADMKSQTGYGTVEEEEKELLKKLRQERDQLIQVLQGLAIDQLVIENMEEMFLADLIRLKDAVFELEEKKKVFYEKDTSYQKQLLQLTLFLKEFNLSEDRTALEKIQQLRKQAERLYEIQLQNGSLAEQLEGIETEHQRLIVERANLEQALTQLRRQVSRLSDQEELEAGKTIYLENHKILLRLGLVEEKLEAIEDYHECEIELKTLTAAHPQLFSSEGIEAAAVEQEEVEEQLQRLKDQEKELQIQSQALLEKTTLDEIESKLSFLEEEKEKAIFKRDRLLLLSEVLKRADENFREENQPDVLKNASHYFNQMTGGRYTQIYLEEEEGETLIRLKEKEGTSPLRVGESLSKGTLNQLYLALRLSLIDHLDHQGESLPICFDELFINFDQERLAHYLDLLKEIGLKRQIFIFTCHQWMADKLQQEFGVEPIYL